MPSACAAERKDLELLSETLRDDVVLHSPILFRGFEGRELVGQVLTHVAATLEDLTYVEELRSAGASPCASRLGSRTANWRGSISSSSTSEGRVAELTVFMRPMSAFHPLQRENVGSARRRLAPSLPLQSPRPSPGGVSERLKETGCKPVGYAYAGSNPASPIRSAVRAVPSLPSAGGRSESSG